MSSTFDVNVNIVSVFESCVIQVGQHHDAFFVCYNVRRSGSYGTVRLENYPWCSIPYVRNETERCMKTNSRCSLTVEKKRDKKVIPWAVRNECIVYLNECYEAEIRKSVLSKMTKEKENTAIFSRVLCYLPSLSLDLDLAKRDTGVLVEA